MRSAPPPPAKAAKQDAATANADRPRSERISLQQGEARLRLLYENIKDYAVIMLDREGRVVSWNKGAEEIKKYKEEEIIGRSMECFYTPEEIAIAKPEALLRQAAAEGSCEDEGWRVCKDGTRFYADMILRSMSDEAGRIIGYAKITRDITERKRAEAELRDRESRMRAIVNTVVDGIITIDGQGTVETFNPAAACIFGYSADEVVGHNVKMLMPDPYRREHDGYLDNYARTGQAKVIGSGREVTGLRKDGSTFPMELAISEMQVSGKRMFTGIVRDITERKQIERMKNEFIAMVSHELRTPLTSIRGALGLMADGALGPVSPKAGDLLRIAYKNSERLTNLINDILDFEKITSGMMQFNFTNQNLEQLLSQAIEANREYARPLGVTLELVPLPRDIVLCVDSDRFMQVMANLLSNACKFSQLGGKVEVSVAQRPSAVRISVLDHGNGIPSDFQERIFQRFSQADASNTRIKSGSGLGLSISKAIVEHMGGQIGFDTKAGEGTEFYFELPLSGGKSEKS